MRRDIPKLCADSLRSFAKDKYGIQLKAAHAHELVAAYLGYRSRNALLADNKYPIENLAEAEVVVMIPDEEIDLRRQRLEGLSTELPDSYTLGEAVYVPLFADERWGSDDPPFRSLDKLARVLVENNEAYRSVFGYQNQIPMRHFPIIKQEDDAVIVYVVHSYETTPSEMSRDGQTTITLPRVAGRIGFGTPEISVGRYTGGARTTLQSLARG